jgi:hypothetical protein
MPAKTCLLCGKTLVFIRVGAGGDFCSREHRNQYQLRRGMDCLAEANKVATLARRRETPKAQFGEGCAGMDNAVGRAFLDTAPFGVLGGVNPGLRASQTRARATWLPQAVAIAKPILGAAPRAVRRETGMAYAGFVPAAAPFVSTSVRKPGGLGKIAERGLHGIAVKAAPGNAFRVSSSAGFRLKGPQPRKVAFTLPTDRGGILGKSALAASLPFALRKERPGAAGDARLAFVDMGFLPAEDAPVSLKWLAADRPEIIRRERR